MIRTIIFDLDGVLVDADRLHFDALNMALELHSQAPISWQEHLTIYKGIPTVVKLAVLTQRKGLPVELYEQIRKSKQEITISLIEQVCFPDWEKIRMLELLR